MATIFNAPVAAIGNKKAFGVSLLRCATGKTICYTTGVFTTFFIGYFPLNDKSLAYVGKIQIIVKFCSSPNFTYFYPPMIRRIIIYKIWFSPLFKVKGNIFNDYFLL
jgi:hypothetical protein